LDIKGIDNFDTGKKAYLSHKHAPINRETRKTNFYNEVMKI
jgi:hypothetical protein